MENYIKEIKGLNKTYVSLNEIEEIIRTNDYEQFVKTIKELTDINIIKPIKTKNNTNGKMPALYLKYRIIKDKAEDNEIENEIKHLSPELKIEKYLNNKKIYKIHRTEIKQLDCFLKNKKEKLHTKISKNERAYQIWGYEKMIDSAIGKSIINFNNLRENLNYYLTPEPFFDYILEYNDDMTILVIENKDTWYTLRKIAIDKKLKQLKIFGENIEGLIYGEGNKITKPKSLEIYAKEMLGRQAKFLYWGDLDFSGIDMFERVRKENPNIEIKLFNKIYEKMLQLSNEKNLHDIRKEQNKNINISQFLRSFNDISIQEKIECLLNSNKYIPQEIINYEEFEKELF